MRLLLEGTKPKIIPRLRKIQAGYLNRDRKLNGQTRRKPCLKKLSSENLCGGEAYVAAYLSCWLCAFVLPENEDRGIRPATFEVARLMAEGRTFSLAVPVLSKIYKGLNEFIKSPAPAYSKSFFPAHYLYGWLAYYFGTHHGVESPPPGPSMVVYSGAQGAKAYTDDGARRLIHEGRDAKANCFILNKNKVENLYDDGLLDSTRFNYFVSLRSSYLPSRMGNSFHVEPYNPHRFSGQFGFCQDIPGLLIRSTGQRTTTPRQALRF